MVGKLEMLSCMSTKLCAESLACYMEAAGGRNSEFPVLLWRYQQTSGSSFIRTSFFLEKNKCVETWEIQTDKKELSEIAAVTVCSCIES